MIDFKNVVIKYGDFIAMNDLNLHIKEGEFFSFLGPSGSGKTTVLRALTGFVKPSSGDILIGEHNITNVPIEKRNIGIVFQSYALFPTMNVYENIAYGLRIRKMSKEQIEREVFEIAEKIDLTKEQLYKKVTELSGGQQQRVAIARAMVIKPKILCLDEPLSNLDAKLRNKLRLELKMLQKQFGITTIYVTHDQEEALTLSDRIAVFDNGNLQQVGTPDEIFNSPKTEFVANFIGEVNKIDAKKFSALIPKEIQLEENCPVYLLLHTVHSQSEDAMFEITGKITAVDFFGFYAKYTLTTTNEIEINFIVFLGDTTQKQYQIGENASIYIHPKDIRQYNSNEVL